MPRLPVFGLRLRLLGALLLTSIVTLAVAALALLSPLEHKLRVESETSLYTAVHATKSEFGDIRLDPRTHLPEDQELRLTLSLLRHRTTAQVWLLTATLQQVGRGAPTDLNVPTYYGQVRQALAEGRGVHRIVGSLFVLAEPLRIGGRRFALVVIRRLDYVSSAVGVVQEAFIEAAAAGFGIALLLGLALTGTLLRRLRQLRDAARELERHGLATTIRVKPGNDEIGELANTLRSMQSRLRHQEEALHAFVATASHELRTPLASLDGMLELIADDLEGDQLDLEDARARTARAREQSRRLSRLASDLLDLSRLDAEVTLRSEPVELSELARAVAAELDLRATRTRRAARRARLRRPRLGERRPGRRRADRADPARQRAALRAGGFRDRPRRLRGRALAGVRRDPRARPRTGCAERRARADLRALPTRRRLLRTGRLRPRPGDRA